MVDISEAVTSSADEAQPQPADSATEALDISFRSHGNRLIRLGLINGILTVLTLGIYSFWGKTEVRKRLWSFTRLNDEPLVYTGTGRELMLGFVIASFVIVVPVLIITVSFALTHAGEIRLLSVMQFVIYVIVFFLIGNAMYRAQRYRMSRTEWRGIRGWLAGSPNAFGWVHFYTIAVPFLLASALAGFFSWLIGPTVGGLIVVIAFVAAFWVFPWRANLLRGLITRDMRFGDVPLSYDGTAGPLYRRFAGVWLGTIVIISAALAAIAAYLVNTGIWQLWMEYGLPPAPLAVAPVVAIAAVAMILVGIVTASYRARQYQHFAQHTKFQGGRFEMAVSGPGLAWLTFTNWMIILGAVILALAGTSLSATALFPLLPATDDGEQAAAMLSGLITATTLIFFVVALTTARVYTQLRTARYLVTRTSFNGTVSLRDIAQSSAERSARGEGLAQVFNIDAF